MESITPADGEPITFNITEKPEYGASMGVTNDRSFIGRWECEKHGTIQEDSELEVDRFSTLMTITIGDDEKRYCMKCISDFMAKTFLEVKYVKDGG